MYEVIDLDSCAECGTGRVATQDGQEAVVTFLGDPTVYRVWFCTAHWLLKHHKEPLEFEYVVPVGNLPFNQEDLPENVSPIR